MKTTRFLWIDLETTGLDPDNDKILEVAWSAQPLVENNKASSNAIFMDAETFDILKSNPFVYDMHKETGLLFVLSSDHVVHLYDVESRIIKDLEAQDPFGTEDIEWVIAGASVHFDLAFVKAYMPRLARMLSYRCFDVSTLKMFFSSVSIKNSRIGDNSNRHRAQNDIEESMNVAYQYKEIVKDRHNA